MLLFAVILRYAVYAAGRERHARQRDARYLCCCARIYFLRRRRCYAVTSPLLFRYGAAAFAILAIDVSSMSLRFLRFLIFAMLHACCFFLSLLLTIFHAAF